MEQVDDGATVHVTRYTGAAVGQIVATGCITQIVVHAAEAGCAHPMCPACAALLPAGPAGVAA